MTQRANPAPLGLVAFGFTTWMLSMINAGWYPATGLGLVLTLAFAFGGTAQMVAAVMEYVNGNTFGTTAFFAYGAFWWSFALFVHVFGGQAPAAFVGWYLFVWGVFTFYMWVATFQSDRALYLVFLALWITFLFLALGAWGVGTFMTTLGGYVGLITAALAIYASAAGVINGNLGRVVLPTGAPHKSA